MAIDGALIQRLTAKKPESSVAPLQAKGEHAAAAPMAFRSERARVAYERWCATAYDGELDKLRGAGKGERNNTLNVVAMTVGQLVAGGHVSEARAYSDLESAAKAIGLTASETRKTILSGMQKGETEPRQYVPRQTFDDEDANAQAPAHLTSADPKRKSTSDSRTELLARVELAAREQDWPTLHALAPAITRAVNSKATVVETGFPLVAAADLWAPLEEPSYLVEGLLTRGCLAEVVGYGAGAKTWLAVELAVAVASGTRWLDRFDVEQGRVAYLDWENGSYELRRRLQGVQTARGLPVPEGISASFFPGTYMTSDAFEAAVSKLGSEHDLVIIDTMRAASPGVDENASEIRSGLDVLRRVGEQSGCTFVVLLHSKKTSGSITKIDAREAGRGSSAIFDAGDVVVHVTYDKEREPPFEAHQTKARNGKAVEPFGFSIVDVDGGVRLDAIDLPDKDEVERGDRSRAWKGKCERVLVTLRANARSTASLLAERSHIRKSTVLAILEQLEKDGAAKNLGTAKKTEWVATGAGGVTP